MGGIYYFGVGGAIYGPLVLCAAFVVLSLYPSLMRTNSATVGGPDRTALATPYVKRSESVC